jgi:hypothetical protein
MYRPQRLRLWASVLLAASICWSAAGFAQKAASNPKVNGNAAKIKNSNRQSVRTEVLAAASARAQGDEQYKRYIVALELHNQQVKAFVQAHRGAR